MKKTAICLLLLSTIACRKKYTRSEIESELSNAMLRSLYEKVDNDSSRVKYRVQQVYYFEEPNSFDCEFRVKMLVNGHDTTGVMKATIDKKFSKVTRIY